MTKFLLQPQVVAALIGFVGILVGLAGRDVIMAMHLANQHRKLELSDRKRSEGHERRDIFRVYADPLRRALSKLEYRLIEIIDRGPASYLRLDAPLSTFDEYKRLSTIYRLASVLGWIQAFRRERSYLDPAESTGSDDIEATLQSLEKALADGQHVEHQRLDELLRIWCVPSNIVFARETRDRLAAQVDSILREQLGKAKVFDALALDDDQTVALCESLAASVSAALSVNVPRGLVLTEARRARESLGIKEAYLYRDWQAAIGDMMLLHAENAARRFDVIGYGAFERLYTESRGGSPERVWFDRLDELFHGLDMSRTTVFDARQAQIRELAKQVKKVDEAINGRWRELTGASKTVVGAPQ